MSTRGPTGGPPTPINPPGGGTPQPPLHHEPLHYEQGAARSNELFGRLTQTLSSIFRRPGSPLPGRASAGPPSLSTEGIKQKRGELKSHPGKDFRSLC